jgi:hypothetical protein
VTDTKTRVPLAGTVIRINGTTHEVTPLADGDYFFKKGQKFPYVIITSVVCYQTTEITGLRQLVRNFAGRKPKST